MWTDIIFNFFLIFSHSFANLQKLHEIICVFFFSVFVFMQSHKIKCNLYSRFHWKLSLYVHLPLTIIVEYAIELQAIIITEKYVERLPLLHILLDVYFAICCLSLIFFFVVVIYITFVYCILLYIKQMRLHLFFASIFIQI